MENPNLLLTIVVPIYNVERYLRQCLDSLVYQTVTDFKVVLVDDGSTDNSGAIAKEYAQTYPEQFRYVYKENAGLGAARNTGFEYVDTPYVEYLDSDDWLMPRTVERILKTLEQEQEDADILFMNPVVFDMATNGYCEWMDAGITVSIFNQKHVTNPQVNPNMYSLEANVNRSVWRADFLRKMKFSFPEGVKWEDVFPHFYLFHHARRCVFVSNAGFVYRVNSGSQITAMSGSARLDIVPVFTKTLDYALEQGWSDQELAYITQMMVSFIRWSLDMSNRQVRIQLTEEVHAMVKRIPKRIVKLYYRIFHVGQITKLYLWVLRSDLFYKKLQNRHKEELWMDRLLKIKRIVKRGR